MFLFLFASMPLLFCCVILLPWGARQTPRTLTLVSTFLKGVLLFFPLYLALLIVRRIFGFSYDGFLLLLSLFQHDHLFPLLAGVAGFLVIQKSMKFPATDEGIFLTVFSCISGFLSVLNIADGLRTWGSWDGYVLFIVPGLRIAAALMIALAAQRYYRWEGRDGLKFCAVTAACALALAAVSFLYAESLAGVAALLCVLLATGGISMFSMRFPRALRG